MNQVDRPDPELQALAELKQELLRAESARGGETLRQRFGDWRTAGGPGPLLAAGVGLILVATALSFTPPGQAVAEQIGELVGIGDDPTVPLHGLNESDAAVLGTGTAPDGRYYEIIVTRSAGPGEDEACLGIDFPDAELDQASFAVQCLTGASRKLLEEGRLRPLALPLLPLGDEADLFVQTLAVAPVTRMALEYRNEAGDVVSVPATEGRLEGELRERFGQPSDVGAFVAFLPSGLLPDHLPPALPPELAPLIPPEGDPLIAALEEALAAIDVVAYDADENEVARNSLEETSRSIAYTLARGEERPRTEEERESDQAELEAAIACNREILGERAGEEPHLEGGVIEALHDCLMERREEIGQ